MSRIELLRARLTNLQTLLDAAERAKNQARQALATATQNGAPERELEELRQDLAEAQAAYRSLKATYDSAVTRFSGLLQPSRTPPPPPPPRRGPPPSTGKTVDPKELLASLQAMPKTSLQNEWGFDIKWPSMGSTKYAVTKGLAILNHGGEGPDGVLAKLQPHHQASRLELDGLSKIRWGAMTYGMDATWDDVYVHDIKEEHAWYDKSCWNKTMRRWYATEVGSQCFQDVNRGWEMVNPADIADPYHTGVPSEVLIENCAAIECGTTYGARPAYAYSYFEPQGIAAPGGIPFKIHRNLTVRGCHLESWKYPNFQASGGLAYSFGAIMCHAYRKVAILDTRVLYAMPDRGVIQIWGCDEVYIIGGESNDYWQGKTLDIDIRGEPGCKIIVQDHKGKWRARVLKGGYDCWYKFQDQQIAPYLIYTHESATQGSSFELTI